MKGSLLAADVVSIKNCAGNPCLPTMGQGEFDVDALRLLVPSSGMYASCRRTIVLNPSQSEDPRDQDEEVVVSVSKMKEDRRTGI